MSMSDNLPPQSVSWRPVLLVLAMAMLIQAALLTGMGQPLICTCGSIKLWQGTILSPENSQQITDWYTFSHILHGVIFFLVLQWLTPRLPLPVKLATAIGIEVAWELAENSPPVIARYREQALAQGYSGDSVLNSVSDLLAMTTGFFIARTFGWRQMLVFIVAVELFTMTMVRDGLALNIIQLIAPNEAISSWQAGPR